MDVKEIKEILRERMTGVPYLVPEDMGKAILAQYGIKAPPGKRVMDAAEANVAASEVGYPVVLKAMTPDLIHKTDLGAVRVGLKDSSEVRSAVHELLDRFQGAPLLVEKMIGQGVEIILGLQNDAYFGPCLMIGFGGILTDLLRDVGFVMLPAGRKEVKQAFEGLKGFKLLTGFRGMPACDVDKVVDAALGLAQFGIEALAYYESVDVNPLIVQQHEVAALDVKIFLNSGPIERTLKASVADPEYLDRFFSPRSVAVIGASGTPDKIGYVVMDSLVNHAYQGRVYPVTPNRNELFGLRCFPSLQALPEAVDLAIIIVDLALIPQMLDDCHEKGVHAVLIISGGGKELGNDRAEIEYEIRRKAKEHRIRIIGPNCIGSFCGSTRFDTFFYTHERVIRPPDGPLGMISQSGTWGCLFLETAGEIGVHKMVSYGNRADVDEADLLEHMSGDPQIKVLASYIEGLDDGRRFVQTARGIMRAKDKPVVVFKCGRTQRGAMAAVGHTGAYGGSYEVYRDVFKQHGIIDTYNFMEFFASCKALATLPLPKGNRVAMVSNGAGPMISAIDQLQERGLEMAVLGRDHVQTMRGHFPFFYLVENPVDVTGSASADDYAFVIEQFMRDDEVDIIMPWFVFQDTPLDESAPVLIGDLLQQYKKPVVGGAAGGPYTSRVSRLMEKEGIAMFSDVSAWTAAARALYLWSIYRENF